MFISNSTSSKGKSSMNTAFRLDAYSQWGINTAFTLDAVLSEKNILIQKFSGEILFEQM